MTENNDPYIYELMTGIRKFTRTTLMHQHKIAQSAGLNATDAECIDFLQEMGPSTAGALAEVTGLTTGAITFVIDRLEKAGFVKRDPDPKDRRKVVVSIRPQKHKDIHDQYVLLAKDVKKLLSSYKRKELKFLSEFTTRLTSVYEKSERQNNALKE